jgi:hypothetical protein
MNFTQSGKVVVTLHLFDRFTSILKRTMRTLTMVRNRHCSSLHVPNPCAVDWEPFSEPVGEGGVEGVGEPGLGSNVGWVRTRNRI